MREDDKEGTGKGKEEFGKSCREDKRKGRGREKACRIEGRESCKNWLKKSGNRSRRRGGRVNKERVQKEVF